MTEQPYFAFPVEPMRLNGLSVHTVFDAVAETGGYRFTHGPAGMFHNGKLFCAFAYNEGKENTVTEELAWKVSDDGGMTWSVLRKVPNPCPNRAISHGAFWKKNGELWLAAPMFNGKGERIASEKGDQLIHFLDLKTVFFRYDDERDTFVSMPETIPDFWPLQEAVTLSDGSTLMAGIDGRWLGAIARKDARTGEWTVCHPDTDGHAFVECNLYAAGDMVTAVFRNEAREDDPRCAAVAVSTDGGRTFSRCTRSALLMNASKPSACTLRNGTPVLVYNCTPDDPGDRSRLLLCTLEKDAFQPSAFFLVDEDPLEKWICYPYVMEEEDILYVFYSAQSRGAQAHGEPHRNLNDIKMAAFSSVL